MWIMEHHTLFIITIVSFFLIFTFGFSTNYSFADGIDEPCRAKDGPTTQHGILKYLGQMVYQTVQKYGIIFLMLAKVNVRKKMENMKIPAKFLQ